MIKIRLGLQRKKTRRFFLLLFFSSFLFLYLAQPLPVKASEEDERRIQQLLEQANQAAASGGINNLADLQRRYDQFERQTKKQYGSMDKAAKTWEKTQTAIEYFNISAKVRWLSYRAQVTAPPPLVSHFNFSGTREFRGRFWKTHPTGVQNPPDYGFEWLDQTGPLQGVSASADSVGGACQGTQWIVTDNSHLKPNGSYLSPIGIYITLTAGIEIPYGDCVSPPPFLGTKREPMNGWGTTEDHDLGFVMTKQDVDAFMTDGSWSKNFSGVVFSENPASVPPGKLFVLAPSRASKYMQFDATVQVEFFLSPHISGPHLLVNPVATRSKVGKNVILKADCEKGWTMSEIYPLEDWGTGDKVLVQKVHSTPAPHASLELKPVKAGKIRFAVNWHDPKGKPGKSKPHDLSVVELTFEPEKKCTGFDDARENEPIPVVSVCENKDKTIFATVKPAGMNAPIKYSSSDPNVFHVTPATSQGAPPDNKLTLHGHASGSAVLTAEVEIEEGEMQKLAELDVDVLKPVKLTVLPIRDEIAVQSETIKSFYPYVKEVHEQGCVELVFTDPILGFDPAQRLVNTVPVVNDKRVYCYNNANSATLEEYRVKLPFPQELTSYFFADVGLTRYSDGSPIVDETGAPVMHRLPGFRKGRYTVIGLINKNAAHAYAHEIGHYLFDGLYEDPKRPAVEVSRKTDEGETVTEFIKVEEVKDVKMLMYYLDDTKGCEVRQREWKKVQR